MTLRNSILPLTLLLSLPPGLLLADRTTSPPGTATEIAGSVEEATREAIERALDAVYPALVRIHVVFEEGTNGRMEKRRASGSGTIIDEEGHVLTNHHVAGRATRVVCRLSNREEVDAVVVGTDALSDLCVLKLDLTSRRD